MGYNYFILSKQLAYRTARVIGILTTHSVFSAIHLKLFYKYSYSLIFAPGFETTPINI
jgi:hypothetical protein